MNSTRLHRLLAPLLLLLAAGMASVPEARAAWPERPIRIVLPYTPGAATDLSIRLLQPSMQKTLGQPVIIDYKPGAGGDLAVQEVSRAQPDGYTLLLAATNSFVIDPHLRHGPVDPRETLVPIVKTVEVPAVLFASQNMKVKDWAGVERKLKSGEHLNFGSPGVGTTPHLSMLLLSKTLGVDITHVPFKGSQAAIQALVGGDIQLYMGNFQPLQPFIATQRVVPIAVVSKERLAGLPNVPTTAEAKVPPVLENNWFAVAAPKGTPSEALSRLEQAFLTALKEPDVRTRLEQQGFTVSGSHGDALRQALSAESAKWAELIKKEGIKWQE